MTLPNDASVKGDILIVDDTPDNLRLLSAMLGRHQLGVRKALTGHWAIAAAQAAPPDLILLDN
jgi:CheY-like chemotaxis protein